MLESPAQTTISKAASVVSFKLWLEQLTSDKQSAENVVHMAWFNPGVATYWLEQPTNSASFPSH